MNGLGLLVALTAIGVEVGWEPTPSGGEVYTIRAESIVIESLRKGDAIRTKLEYRDRNVREFRVVVGPKRSQGEPRRRASADEVQYGWNTNESGGIDYYVQMLPERLETLAAGTPLECVVHPDVPEIDEIWVFTGTEANLPKNLPTGTRAAPRDITSVASSSGGSVTRASNNEATSTSARYGDTGNTQVSVSDTATNKYGPSATSSATSRDRAYGPATAGDYRTQTQGSGYGQRGDTTIPVPSVDEQQRPDYARAREQSYDYGRDPYGARRETVTRESGYGQYGYGGQTQSPYGGAAAQTAALPQQPRYAPQPTVPVSSQQPAAPANDNSAILQTLLAMQQQNELKQKQLEEERKLAEARAAEAAKASANEPAQSSSKPLIITTAALFASIAANTYLGWLAWSFFWRFRDAASDLSRARSSSFPAASV